MRTYFKLLLFYLFNSNLVQSQIDPTRFIFPDGTVNGSSATGGCSDVTTGLGGGILSQCNDPTTSVLFDGNIPALTGLDGDMWASHLLTLPTSESQIDIRMEFPNVAESTSISGGEVVMFNCPEWGISAQSIIVLVGTTLEESTTLIGSVFPDTSCDSLVRVCVPLDLGITIPVVELLFILPPDSDWVHLAEVAFYGNPRSCTSGSILSPTATAEMATATTADETTSSPLNNVTSFSMAEGTTQAGNFPSSDSTLAIIIPIATVSVLLIIILILASMVCIVVCWKKSAALPSPDADPVYETPGCVTGSEFIMTPSTAYGVIKPPQLPDIMTENSVYEVPDGMNNSNPPLDHKVPDVMTVNDAYAVPELSDVMTKNSAYNLDDNDPYY